MTAKSLGIDTIRFAVRRQHLGSAALWRWLSRLTEPHILFSLVAVLVLVVIWGATLHLIKVERAAAQHTAAVSAGELADTYEAQVVRALREIDQTLKFVKYAYELRGQQIVLQELKEKDLLPPDLLFTVSIADSEGKVVASTRPSTTTHVAGRDYFLSQRQADVLSVGQPRLIPSSGEWEQQFSRRLNAADGTFSGIVMVSVDAAYFVSGYDSAKLGERGVLGILGADGIFRARRSGETVSAGDKVDYAAVVPATEDAEVEAALSTNAWDGVQRYTSASELYDFPLAVIVGLSQAEQLAVAQRNSRVYLWRAGIGSVLVVLLSALLGRMSWQLSQGRLRESEATVAHAKQVEYLAYHDGLTGLPNRSLFSKLLSRSITEAHRYGKQLAVSFLDLDRFKQINDTLGHEAGDELLKEVANRLTACVRDSDTIARLGGDEFVVLLPELGDGKYAATVAQKILSAIAKPFTLLGQEFRVTASIGISTYPQDGLDEQTLTKNADIAMYQAKEEGKNNFQFFSPELNANSLERLTLESSLRRALERNEFRLNYQAKRDIASGRITGMETLLRWEHPDLGTVAPMKFIPIAEETGLILPIGKWVLQTACLQNVAWQKQGLPAVSIAVNLTARQFSDDALLPDIATILKTTGMDAHLLELEITESMLIHNMEKTLQILTQLKALGVRIAVDDFGTGYSSLSMLQRFPLDTIKIDRSFISAVTGAAHEDTSLTEAIISMGKSLSLTVVAQGVETKDQADYLRKHACDEFQGFYFNKPMAADQFTDLLRAQATEVTYVGTRAALMNT